MLADHPGSQPPLVTAALARAAAREFPFSCEDPAGPLLAALACAVPHGGRILELGTGTGAGTAWIVSGLKDRSDVAVCTVEHDADLAAETRGSGWPEWVEVITGDAEALLPALGAFELVFADAPGGKWTGLDRTLTALRPGGVLLVDDMNTSKYQDPAAWAAVAAVRQTLTSSAELTAAELAAGSGIILVTKRRDAPGTTRAAYRNG